VTHAGTIETFETPIPQLGEAGRKVRVYLPPGYSSSGPRCPVLYMQDGQNIFRTGTSYAGEWEADRALDERCAAGGGGALVVGVDNGGAARFDEYSPWTEEGGARGGRGMAYAEFLARTLKPLIDGRFRTLPGREFTGVAGSSMGGLISLYAALAYNDVFSMAGVFSPAFWFARGAAAGFVKSSRPSGGLRVYMDAGTVEEPHREEYVSDARTMGRLLAAKGGVELRLVVDEGAAHNEAAWRRRFPAAFDWLFSAAPHD